MSLAQPPDTSPALPDRSTWLTLFGSFQILLGCLCGLMALMMVFMSVLGPMAGPPQGQATTAQMMPAAVVYLLLAVVFIWLGVGSVRARRWAWTLTVVLSWMWLIMGGVGFVFSVIVARPMMSAAMEQQGKMPPQTLVIIQIITGRVLGCIYILLPALFLVFYHRESVRATCQRRDPQIPLDGPLPHARVRSEHPLRLVGGVHAYDGGLRLCDAGVWRGSFRRGRRGGDSAVDVGDGLPCLGNVSVADGRLVGNAAALDRWDR